MRYAVRDAKEVANVLIENFGFKSENVIQLYDKDATKEGIMRAFDWIRQLARVDDRVLVFYAGHGITIRYLMVERRGTFCLMMVHKVSL